MLQSVHIFRKDAFHLRPEIAVNLLLFVAFAWAAPSHWTGSLYAGPLALLAALLHVLLPIAWLVLISRAVHDEPLVGDRQFWTSRPYHWASLLGAKLLFVAAFIFLPFLLMQVYLLHHAGLYPTQALPALFGNLGLLATFFVLPIMALAAVTNSFVRLALSVLATIVYLLVIGGVIAWSSWGHMSPPHLSTLSTILVVALIAAVLIYQYATRQTTNARIALIALPVVMALLFAALPAGMLIHGGYPSLAATVAPKLSPIPDELRPKPSPTDPLQVFRGDVLLMVPMQVAGVDENTLFRIDGYTLTVDAPGTHWTGPWQISGEQVSAGTPATYVQVPMPQAVFEKIRNTPADLHLTLALDHMKVGAPYLIKTTRTRFPIPGHGACSFDTTQDDPNPDSATPVCRFPFSAPDSTFIAAQVTPTSCAAPPATIGHTNLRDAGPSLSFDPVQTLPLNLTTGDPDPKHQYLLCPGSDLSVFQAKEVDHGSTVFAQKAVILDPYAARIARATQRMDVPQQQPGPQPMPGPEPK